MLTGTYIELLKPEFDSLKINPEYLQDDTQVNKEINVLNTSRHASRNICIFLWIIVAVTGLSCIASIAFELLDFPPLCSDPAIKGSMMSFFGFVPMLVYYNVQKGKLDKKLLLLKLLRAHSSSNVTA
jgi:anaerobic C4-dicarboxylate transporter